MRILIILLIISVIGNFIGLFILYKYFKKTALVLELKEELLTKHKNLEIANSHLPTKIVFIHHSVGRNWLKEGGLLDSLTARKIAIQSATNRQGCEFAEETDMHNWVPKFQNSMNKIIHYDKTITGFYNDSRENEIIMFKPCYPNSNIVDESVDDSLENKKTIGQYKQYFEKLKIIFAKYPDKKFIYVTAPPMVPNNTSFKNAARAKEFNDWLLNEYRPSYLQESSLNNLYIFDLFEVLADDKSVLKQEYRRAENDSHPNKTGSQAATLAFLEFLEKNNNFR